MKNKIQKESDSYLEAIKESSQYGSLTKEERDKLGAFYTPPQLCIQMLEMFDFESIEDFAKEDILDPTCGSGNLIMAALIVGSSVDKYYPEKVFGNELSESPLKVARKRFVDYCKKNGLEKYDEEFWNWHLHQGDALTESCIVRSSFTPKYKFLKKRISTEEYSKLADTLKNQYTPDEVVMQKTNILNTKRIVKSWKLS